MQSNKPKSPKKIFKELGTCSRTFTFILNREFGHNNENAECAAAPLAGGIIQRGHQCGMLWGSALAIGAEAHRRFGRSSISIKTAINASQNIIESFSKRTGTINCRDITSCDFNSRWSFIKYFFSGRFLNCYTLANKWASEAIEEAKKGLSTHKSPNERSKKITNCASEVLKKMGATEKEQIMVAGFAGGIGLSGGGCGALGAAIWMNSLRWYRINQDKSTIKIPEAENTLSVFEQGTNSKFLCSEICERQFSSVEDHSEYIRNGGCENIIHLLSKAPKTN